MLEPRWAVIEFRYPFTDRSGSDIDPSLEAIVGSLHRKAELALNRQNLPAARAACLEILERDPAHADAYFLCFLFKFIFAYYAWKVIILK